MNLSTKYLGMTLKNPFMPGASPLTDSIDMAKRLEDAGAGALVLRSLFEEQIEREENAFHHHVSSHGGAHAEASGGFLPSFDDFAFNTERYLNHISLCKKSVGIPIIASLNGISHGGWEKFSKQIEEAGADALELNFYDLPTDPNSDAVDVEAEYVTILENIRSMVKIPLAVKLSPFFSSLPHFAQQLSKAGADGIVLFNRLYQPDIDIESLQVRPYLQYSTSGELALRLRWLAILEPHFKGSMAAGGGVHTSSDAIKAIMAGASGVQLVSSLLKNGPNHLKEMISSVSHWLVDHEYESLNQMKGSMSLRTCPDPTAFGRTNYMKTLHGWKVLTANA
jgi:dihydroorotate dehydrogenase (fumarate)